MPLASNSISVVVSLHMIEHLYHPEIFLKEAARVVVPGGFLLIATPNPKGVAARLIGQKWSGWRDDHVSLFSPKVWVQMVKGVGFKPIRVGTTGLSGIPLFRSTPFAIFNYLPLLAFGILPWQHGEAFIGLFQSIESDV